MIERTTLTVLVVLIIGASVLASVQSESASKGEKPRWLTLPATPTLPRAVRSDYAPINGVKLWYAFFGNGEPVFMLHGGLANSNYWGNQVPVLAKHYQVIVMDSRGHGRSTRDQQAFSYHLMATDVIGLMDFLKIEKAAIVGWSDGANICLDLAINYPDRVSRGFVFAANTNPSAVKDDLSKSDVFNAYVARTESEYRKLSPTPGEYKTFLDQIYKMWTTQPNFTAQQLGIIKVPVWIVGADHEEAIKRENTLFMFDNIPGAALLIQAGVSHFSFIQAPLQFNDDVLHFLKDTR